MTLQYSEQTVIINITNQSLVFSREFSLENIEVKVQKIMGRIEYNIGKMVFFEYILIYIFYE